MGRAIRQSGRVGRVIWALLVCHRWVGSQVLATCLRLYLVVAVGGTASLFFLSLGTREVKTCFAGSGSLALALASLFFWRTVFRPIFNFLSALAVSSRSRSLAEGFLVAEVTVGVLSSFIYPSWSVPSAAGSINSEKRTSWAALGRRRLGTFLTLWLAVLRLNERGTC